MPFLLGDWSHLKWFLEILNNCSKISLTKLSSCGFSVILSNEFSLWGIFPRLTKMRNNNTKLWKMCPINVGIVRQFYHIIDVFPDYNELRGYEASLFSGIARRIRGEGFSSKSNTSLLCILSRWNMLKSRRAQLSFGPCHSYRFDYVFFAITVKNAQIKTRVAVLVEELRKRFF